MKMLVSMTVASVVLSTSVGSHPSTLRLDSRTTLQPRMPDSIHLQSTFECSSATVSNLGASMLATTMRSISMRFFVSSAPLVTVLKTFRHTPTTQSSLSSRWASEISSHILVAAPRYNFKEHVILYFPSPLVYLAASTSFIPSRVVRRQGHEVRNPRP